MNISKEYSIFSWFFCYLKKVNLKNIIFTNNIISVKDAKIIQILKKNDISVNKLCSKQDGLFSSSKS